MRFLFILLFPFLIFGQDVLVERFELDVSSNGQTYTLANDVGSLDKAFVRLVSSSLKASGGQTNSTGNLGPNDVGAVPELTGTSTVTFNKALTNTVKVMCEVWRYVGPSGGDYEFIVRDRGSNQFTSGTSSITVPQTLPDRNRVIPIYNGFRSEQGSNANFEAVTLALHVDGSGDLIISRNNTGAGSTVTGFWQLVDFVGAGWRVGHGVSTNHDTAGLGGISITLNTDSTGSGGSTFDVVDWGTAMILDGTMEGDSVETGLADCYVMYEPNTTTSVTLSLGDNNARNDGNSYVHVLQADDLIVNRGSSGNLIEGVGGTNYGTDITVSGVNSSTPLSELSVEWFVSTTGTGTAWARGSLTAQLISYNTIQHWVHRSGNNVSVKYGVVDLSQLIYTPPVSGNKIALGAFDADAFYLGPDAVDKIYQGTDLLYEGVVSGGGATNEYFVPSSPTTQGASWFTNPPLQIYSTADDVTAPNNTQTIRKLVYTTSVLEAGDYVLWIKGYKSSTGGPVFVAMNDSNDTYRVQLANFDSWNDSYTAGTGNDLTSGDGKIRFTLTNAVHTIEVYGGIFQTILSNIYITKDGDTPN